jgi:hypothetical protein
MKRFFLFLILLSSYVVYAREVPNTNSGIANASPGDHIIRSNGESYILNQGDINHARQQLGLSISPNRSTSSSSNSRTKVSSGNDYLPLIVLIIVGIIIFSIIRKIVEYIGELDYERQRGKERRQYEQQIKRQRQQYEFEIKQQIIAEERRIEGNLNWLKSVRSGREIYNNTKLYITTREWQAFKGKFQFLEITLLDRIIQPDDEIMKPYLKCLIYGSSNNFTALFYLKKTGLENEATIYYCRNKLDDQDLNQIKSFFESTKQNGHISQKLRDKILARDNFRCVFCGRGANDGVALHVCHIIPVSKGGTSTDDNLQTLCEDCSLGNSNRQSRSNYENDDMPHPEMIAFYRNLLGLKLKFTQAELKTAFRERVAKYHPDTYGSSSDRDRENAETLMKQINEAYEALKKIAS